MKMKALSVLTLLAAVFLLASCSGNKTGGCTTNCGGGNANLSITLFDLPPAGVSILSFTLPVAGISLTPSSGSAVTVPITPTAYEMTRLQTDSALGGVNMSVSAGTFPPLHLSVTASRGECFKNPCGTLLDG